MTMEKDHHRNIRAKKLDMSLTNKKMYMHIHKMKFTILIEATTQKHLTKRVFVSGYYETRGLIYNK